MFLLKVLYWWEEAHPDVVKRIPQTYQQYKERQQLE
jgi:hypothetical protein